MLVPITEGCVCLYKTQTLCASKIQFIPSEHTARVRPGEVMG